MTPEVLLQLFNDRQTLLAREAMESPGVRPEFDFGRFSGMYEGLEIAKEIVLGIFEDAKERDGKL